MKVLICSHAAWRPTGYGQPVRPWVAELRKHGHDAAVLALEERGPGVMEFAGIRHYLPHGMRFGENVVGACADHFGADVIVSLMDPWVLGPMGYAVARRPWLAWCPIDQDPPQRGLVERLTHAARVLSYSRFGVDVLHQHAPDLAVSAMPYGVDLGTFKRRGDEERAKLRAALGVPEGAFIVGQVGTNLHHDRKGLKELLQGFAQFAAEVPDAYLVMWTDPSGEVDVVGLADVLGIRDRLRVAETWALLYEGVEPSALAPFYNVMDVLAMPSAAEGFGIPILEAMACGVPVLGVANSSMPELIPPRTGWLIEDITPEWSFLGGWWNRPTVAGVAEGLTRAHRELTRDAGVARAYAEDCRGWARGYGWDLVGERWHELLTETVKEKSR